MKPTVTIHWFRRDLRLEDNAALYHALSNHNNVLPLFIFDTNILDDLKDRSDARVNFIYDIIQKLQKQLIDLGSTILVEHGEPLKVWKRLIVKYNIDAVVTNHDYEPYATKRDAEIKQLLLANNIPFNTFKDQVIFEKNEIVKEDGTPYVVFTPFSRKYKEKLNALYFKPCLLYTSPSPRDRTRSRMPSSA